mmetsp:Transcript_37169/g.116974  ORF Transcript_37169/g.116974 Transcript_37169/m.116974 type:complete len:125 (-) Transcript_37169:1338-1712(-)
MEASKVIKVHPNEPVKDVLKLMSENGISGVPVVDANGKFMDMFSDADILGLTELDLNVPVEHALQRAENGESKPKHCLITDPLSKVISCFSIARTTRLACLDEKGSLQGVVTLVDLFKFLAGMS